MSIKGNFHRINSYLYQIKHVVSEFT